MYPIPAGVYAITNRITGDRYIGSSHMSLTLRFRHHFQLLERRKHHCMRLQYAWIDFGAPAFAFDVLDYSYVDGPPVKVLEEGYMQIFRPAYNSARVVRAENPFFHDGKPLIYRLSPILSDVPIHTPVRWDWKAATADRPG